MAIVEMIASHYTTKAAVKKIIDYVMDPEKTSPEIKGGVYCSPETAVQEFLLTKALFHKETGRQVIHMTQSFAPTDNVTPALVMEIAERFLQHESFKGFQVAYAVHTNKAHLHTHFVINTVNYETGRKWQQTKEELASLKAYSDEICKEYGLSVISKGQERQMSRGAYRSARRSKSYIYETTLAVKVALSHADTKTSFFNNMKALGYRVEWLTGKPDIVFTTPDGYKVYNKSLYPRGSFTKESMEKILGENKIGEREKQDFDKLLKKLVKLQKECQDLDKLPLSLLREKELRQAEQEETIVMASELFLEIALEDHSGQNDAAGSGGGGSGIRSLAGIKDYLAESKKGRGMETDGLER